MTPTNADLRQFILNFFSDEELDTLCFDYFPEVRQDFTIGMIKNSKVMLLIDYCQVRGRGDDLYGALERERPSAWREKFGAAPVETFRRNVSTPLTRDSRQVFISHATANAAFAHRLANDLRAEGWGVWIAPDSIRPGEKWMEAIDRGLETSGVFVVALTPAAVASRWVRTETNAAIDLSQTDEIRFISLDVEQCRLSALWRQFQYITFRRSYEAGLGELLRWLESEEPLPNPLPEGEGVGGLPTSPTELAEKRVKEEQWRQLQALAHEIAAELGKQSGEDETRAVFRRFNREFDLTTYKKLPRRRFVEGLAFLQEWRDEIAATEVEASLLSSLLQGEEAVSHSLEEGLEETALEPLPKGEGAGLLTSFPGYHVLSAERIVHKKTGIDFVCVPAGPFLHGNRIINQKSMELLFGTNWAAAIRARYKTELPEFWISRYPITNAQYKRFLDANVAYAVPFYDAEWAEPYNWDDKSRSYPAGKEEHPVVLVSWNDAKAFCDWAGLRLPTEQEWEKAARGDKDGRIYPWGDDWVDGRCNTSEAGVRGTTRVGQYSPQSDSPYGCADMAGNVWEWTASSHEKGGRVLRGASWDLIQGGARVSVRVDNSPDGAYTNIGFRPLAPVDSGS